MYNLTPDRYRPRALSRGLLGALLPAIILVLIVVNLITGCSRIDPQDEHPLRNPYSAEERRMVDMRLFNELNVRNRGWRNRSQVMRYELIKQMSDEGYELAELTLRLFDIRPKDWDMPFDKEAWLRLRIIADQGDASAMCLAAKAGRKWNRLTNDTYMKYVERAAKQEQPVCMMYYASHLEKQGKINIDDSIKLQEKSARLGNHSMQLILVNDYAKGRRGLPLDIGKAECWLEIAKRPEFDTGEAATYNPNLRRWTRLANEAGRNNKHIKYDPNTWCQQVMHEDIQ